MKKEKRKLNMQKVKICLIIAAVLLLIIVSMIIYNVNKDKNKYKDLTILLNNRFIKTMDEVLIDDKENIYFSKSDIKKIFDDTIYYNQAEKELITTYNTHVALLKVGEKYALVNDQNIELKGELKEQDGKIYMPLTDLQEVYDIELYYARKSNRIIMNTTQEKKIENTILKRTKVKDKKGLFSDTIEKLIIGEKVTVLEEDGKYKKCRTSLGNIGYIKSNVLSEDDIIRDPHKEPLKELKVYKGYGNISGIYEDIKVDESKLNVITPTFYYIEKNSKILDKSSVTTAAYSVYKNWADKNKLEIMPIITNDENVSTSLLSYSQRSQVINSTIELANKNGYKGIIIKFDKIDDPNSFYRFVLEFVPRCRMNNIKVGIYLNENVDRNKIENVVDYIVEE